MFLLRIKWYIGAFICWAIDVTIIGITFRDGCISNFYLYFIYAFILRIMWYLDGLTWWGMNSTIIGIIIRNYSIFILTILNIVVNLDDMGVLWNRIEFAKVWRFFLCIAFILISDILGSNVRNYSIFILTILNIVMNLDDMSVLWNRIEFTEVWRFFLSIAFILIRGITKWVN